MRMCEYVTAMGHRLEYRSTTEWDAFYARVRAVFDDAKTSENDLIRLVYSTDNPILDKQLMPGRGAVTAVVLDDARYHVLKDLLFRKRLADDGEAGALDRILASYSVPLSEAAQRLGRREETLLAAIHADRLDSARKDGEYFVNARWLERHAKKAAVPNPAPSYELSPAKIEALLSAARALDFAMVDCWGHDDDPDQSWDAPAQLVRAFRRALDGLSADGGLANEAHRSRAVAARTEEIARETDDEGEP